MKEPVLYGLYVSHLIPIEATDLNYNTAHRTKAGLQFSCTENVGLN